MGQRHSPRRVLVVGGVARSLVNFRGDLLSELVGRGDKVLCVAAAPSISDLVSLSDIGVEFARIPLERTSLNPVGDYRSYRALGSITDRFKPDLILAYTIKPVVMAASAAHRRGIPFFALITGLGRPFDPEGVLARPRVEFFSQLYKRALRSAAAVIVQNAADREFIISAGMAEENRVHLVNGSGVNIERFPFSELADTDPVVAFVGRISEPKGAGVFVEAARQVAADRADVTFRLIGPTDEAGEELQALVGQGVIDGIVEHVGYTEDVLTQLRASHIVALPSWYREGVPRSLLEALSVGRMIITTDTPGCRTTVEVGENGYLIDVRSPEDLAAAVNKLIDDQARWPGMSRASRALAVSRFDVKIINDQMLSIIDQAIR